MLDQVRFKRFSVCDEYCHGLTGLIGMWAVVDLPIAQTAPIADVVQRPAMTIVVTDLVTPVGNVRAAVRIKNPHR